MRDALGHRGVSFRSAGGAAEFLVDPVPRVLGAGEWAALEAGLTQRVRALDAFVADAYGPRRAVAEGVVPERLIETSEGYEPAMRGLRPPGGTWVGIAGLDLVRDAAGELLVLEDNLRTPSGLRLRRRGAPRRARAPRGAGAELAPRTLAGLPELLGATLRAAAPDGVGGSLHAWCSRTARTTARRSSTPGRPTQLGIPLVEPGDLELRGDVLRHGGRAVDVVYRRTDADTVDTEVGRLLVPPQRAGTLGLVNAFGTGVADDKLAHAYVEELVRFHLGEEPLLRSVQTLDLCGPSSFERALDELETLVVKPRTGHGGHGVVVCAHAEREDVERMRARADRAARTSTSPSRRSRSPCTRR